jgi:imidazolonepropionase-like amidohydrolase
VSPLATAARAAGAILFCGLACGQQFAVRADTLHTMAGEPIRDGVVWVQGGKIRQVGPAASVQLPAGVEVKRAAVCVPGLIDAHATVGLTGMLNIPHDQDQLDPSKPMQPELRAVDAYNAQEELVAWLRSFGITTVHTGHAPGALIAGQTMVVKTAGRSVERDAVRPFAMLACTLGDSGRSGGEARERPRGEGGGGGADKPGTRARSVAVLRQALIDAQAYAAKRSDDANTAIDLGQEALAAVLRREVPLLVTAHRAQDLMSALRVAQEFNLQIVLDGAAEAYLVADEIKKAGCWVLPHPAMARTGGEMQNGTMELPKLLADAGIPFALQSGFEGYVPKTRVVLFEAGVSVGKGLAADRALRALTVDAARLLGIGERTGSLEAGKDGDLALWDGDPFEYTSHCVGVVIGGVVVSDTPH